MLAPLARPARRDRALGAVEAGHRQPADRRLGAARQDRARRMERGRDRPRSRRSGTGSRRPTRRCSPGSKAAPPPPDIGELPNFSPLMLASRSKRAISPGSIRATISPSGNGTASACSSSSRGGERRLYSRSGDDIGAAFPGYRARRCPTEVTLDGELLVMRDGEVAPFNDLQQRLNRKTPSPKMLREYPAAVRLYDILREGAEDLRGAAVRRAPAAARSLVRAGAARRPRLVAAGRRSPSWDELRALRDGARANAASRG